MRTKFPDLTGRMVQITYCWARNSNYDNIKPGTQHMIIKPVKREDNPIKRMYKNDRNHVWVKGSPEPVVLLKDEFILIKNNQK
jgi:hypothetical protein